MEDDNKISEKSLDELAESDFQCLQLKSDEIKLRDTSKAQEKAQFLTAILAASPVGIAHTRGGRIQWANRAWEEMFGFGDKQEYLHQPTSIMHPSSEEYQRVRSVLYDDVNSNGLSETHAVFRRKDGSAFHARIKMSLLDTEDPAKGVISTISDISELRATEDALKDSEQKFRLLVERVHDGIVVAQDGMLRFFNPSAVEILGYAADELSSRPFTEFIHPDDRDMVHRRHVRRLKGEEPPSRYSFRIVRSDGTIGWIAIDSGMIQWDGRPAALFCITDITERKKNEEALRESETRYRSLFENMRNAVAVYGAERDSEDFVILDFNGAAEQIEQVSKDQIIGRSVLDVFPGVQEFGLFEVFQRVWKTGRAEYSPVTFYKDQRIAGWRDNFVYRLPSGEVVAVYSDETERKNAEYALRKSEERFRNIVAIMSDWVWEVDESGVYTYISPKIRDVLGYEPEEALGRTPFDFMSKEEAPRLTKIFESIAATRKPFSFLENTNVSKDGRTVVLETSGVPIFGRNGEFEGYRGVDLDITERRRSEEALRESEAKFRFLTEAMVDIVWTMDLNLQTTYVSPSIETLLGFTQEERQRQKIEDQVTAESLLQIRELLASELEKELEGTADPNRNTTLLAEHYKKDGGTLWLESTVRAVRDANGVLIGIHGLSRDITERKKAEEELRQSEERFRLLADNMTDVIWQMSPDFVLTYVSPSVKKQRGYEPSEVLGRPIWYFFTPASLEQVHKRALDRLQQLLSDRETFIPAPYETEQTRKDGTTVWTETMAVPLFDSDGKLLGFQGVTRDVTKRKKAEEAMKQSHRRLEESQRIGN